MNIKTVGIGVVVLAAAAGAILLVQLWTGANEPDYAELVPAPDSVVWSVDVERTVWLDTNRHAVDLRVSSIDLGLGDIERLDGGNVTSLGRATGCIDWVVSGLTVETVGDDTVEIDGAVDRGRQTGDLTVHIRRTRLDTGAVVTADRTVASGEDTFAYDLGSVAAGVPFRVEASHDEQFPHETTRQITFTGGDASSGTSDLTEEEFHLVENTGIGLVGCHEGDRVMVSLHGDDGEELSSYIVDVLASIGPVTLDYADLVPAPDEIVWAKGDHTTLWLSTNRHAVDVQIDSIALGLGDIEERSQGQDEPHILGVGPGCQDLVVASLTVEHDTGSTWSVSGTIDRGPNTTGDVVVHVRYYRPPPRRREMGRRSTLHGIRRIGRLLSELGPKHGFAAGAGLDE